jgi:hypothetical protein
MKLYGEKDCSYIQISEKGLYHLGNDVCDFKVPEFICEQRLRVRTKIQETKPKTIKPKTEEVNSIFQIIKDSLGNLGIRDLDLDDDVDDFAFLGSGADFALLGNGADFAFIADVADFALLGNGADFCIIYLLYKSKIIIYRVIDNKNTLQYYE